MCCGHAGEKDGSVSPSSSCRRAPAANGMRRSQRLTSRQDFAAVYRTGKAFRSNLLILRTRQNGGRPSRFGYTVGKSRGNAVVRNKVKRRLREIARAASVSPGWDIIMNARRDAARADWPRLQSTVVKLMTRAGVLENREVQS